MLRSEVGARSSSILPMGGMSPLQLQNRMRTKKEAKSGMYGFASFPPSPTPKFSSDS